MYQREEMKEMTVTIYEGYDKTEVLMGCKDERFKRRYGHTHRIESNNLYKELTEVAEWVNNDLGEEFLMEMD
jgi:Txe/YoeB family toxin of Txe-Axe toxin-antitoxin module